MKCQLVAMDVYMVKWSLIFDTKSNFAGTFVAEYGYYTIYS